jgi:hypothetical protein
VVDPTGGWWEKKPRRPWLLVRAVFGDVPSWWLWTVPPVAVVATLALVLLS